MIAKSVWTKFKGINGKLIAVKLSDIVFIEDIDVGGRALCCLRTMHGVSCNVEATIDEVLELIDKDTDKNLERNLDFWEIRRKKREEREKEESK